MEPARRHQGGSRQCGPRACCVRFPPMCRPQLPPPTHRLQAFLPSLVHWLQQADRVLRWGCLEAGVPPHLRAALWVHLGPAEERREGRRGPVDCRLPPAFLVGTKSRMGTGHACMCCCAAAPAEQLAAPDEPTPEPTPEPRLKQGEDFFCGQNWHLQQGGKVVAGRVWGTRLQPPHIAQPQAAYSVLGGAARQQVHDAADAAEAPPALLAFPAGRSAAAVADLQGAVPHGAVAVAAGCGALPGEKLGA